MYGEREDVLKEGAIVDGEVVVRSGKFGFRVESGAEAPAHDRGAEHTLRGVAEEHVELWMT